VTRLYSSICTRGEGICLTFFLKLSELLLLLLLLLLSELLLLLLLLLLLELVGCCSGPVNGP
jgi:hypothetical protein